MMSRFKVNIHQLQEEAAILKDKYIQYKEDQDSLYAVAQTADGYWNDNNTPTFVQYAQSDSKVVSQFHDTILNSIGSIVKFTTTLNKVLEANGIAGSQKSLTYDESYCSKSIRLLNGSIESLRDSKNKIEEYFVACDAAREIEMVKSNIIQSIQKLGSIADSIGAIQKDIEEAFKTANTEISSYELIKIKDNELKYRWTPVSYVVDKKSIFLSKNKTDVSANSLGMSVEEVVQVKIDSSATDYATEQTLQKDDLSVTLQATAKESTDSASISTKTTDATIVRDNSISSENSDFNYQQRNDVSITEQEQQGTLSNTLSSTSFSSEHTSESNYENSTNSFGGMGNSNFGNISNQDYETANATIVNNGNSNISVSRDDYSDSGAQLENHSNVSVSTSQEDYNDSNAQLSSQSNISISTSKDDYSPSQANVGVTSSMGSLSSLKTSEYELGSSNLQASGPTGIQLSRDNYEEVSTNLQMDNGVHLSLEKDSYDAQDTRLGNGE